MTEFTKTKIHFALALLGSLFALHPYLEKFQDAGFLYLGYFLKLSYAYLLLAGLLAFCVYCYGLTLVSERPHSWLEKLGNYSYGLAVMVLPFFGGLYLASLLADRLRQLHLAWAATGVRRGARLRLLLVAATFDWGPRMPPSTRRASAWQPSRCQSWSTTPGSPATFRRMNSRRQVLSWQASPTVRTRLAESIEASPPRNSHVPTAVSERGACLRGFS